jgi:enoyl-CoA hydratase/carnithine racemase
MFAAFFDFPKPLVAGLNGIAAGGGMEIAMFCDLRIAAGSSRWLMAEVDVGLPAIIGSHWLSALVAESRMREIVLSGRRIGAAEALDMGLVHEVVEDSRLAGTALARAAMLADKPPVAMRLNIRRFRELARAGLERGGVFEALRRYQSEAMASGQPQQAMDGFLSSRRARRDERG